MKTACLAALLLAAGAAFAGQPPPPSIKLPTMEDAPMPAPARAKAKPRSKGAAGALPSAMPYIVMYATSTCPYCAKARAYMEARGIAYEERNVDHSRAASQEFHQYGGRGVPLFVVGSEVLYGFSAAALDAAIWRAQP